MRAERLVSDQNLRSHNQANTRETHVVLAATLPAAVLREEGALGKAQGLNHPARS
jgi:hypothetical protein